MITGLASKGNLGTYLCLYVLESTNKLFYHYFVFVTKAPKAVKSHVRRERRLQQRATDF